MSPAELNSLFLLPPVGDDLLELPYDPVLDLLRFVWYQIPQHDDDVVPVEGRCHQDVLVLVEVAKPGGEALGGIWLLQQGLNLIGP